MAYFILADNQELTAAGLEHLIKHHVPTISGEMEGALDKNSLMELLKMHPDSIVLLDYTLFDFKDESSLLVTCERFPSAIWILVSEDLTDAFLRKALFTNPHIGVVFKDSPLTAFQEAIRQAVRGERYICQRATEILFSQHHEEHDAPTSLTTTEIEILTAIAKGKTTKEIAAERFSSIHTINTHRKNIFRKLGVNTAYEAIKCAFKAGLVDLNDFYI